MVSQREGPKQVLVVEDDEDFAAFMEAVLFKAGYAVRCAATAEQGYSKAQTTKPDLITLDIRMPKDSGVHFYRKIKSDRRFRDVPVIVITGLTRNDREMGYVIRAFMETERVPAPNAYLEKPIMPQQLLDAVQCVLG